jgi:acetyl esterase/lipase
MSVRKSAPWAAGLAAVFVSAAALAADPPKTPIAAIAEPNAIPLDTGGVEGQKAQETWYEQWNHPFVRNVSRATLTPFIPERSKANGAAVIVAPGGGFRILSIGDEGWEVAKALRERGVAAFVLKYRLLPTAPDWEEFNKGNPLTAPSPGAAPGAAPARPPVTLPLEDASAAFGLVRARASEWNIDPKRIGMMGFSAGAGTTMAVTLTTGIKPAFIAPIYGSLRAVEVPPDAPPMFVALVADDPLFGKSDFGLITAWQKAGRPVEFHLYQNGGHGFGLGHPPKTSTGWFPQFMLWLDSNGMLKGE